MERLAAGLGAAAATRLPQLGDRVATSLRLPIFSQSVGQRAGLGLALGGGSDRFGMQLDDAGPSMFGRLAGKLYGPSGYDAIAAAFGQQAGGSLGDPFTPTGPGFAGGNLDSAASDINAAAARYGVPARFLATIIAQESTGDFARDGSRFWYGRPQSGPLLPYVGVFQNTAASRAGMSAGQFQSLIGNRAGQIDLLAQVLRSQYDEIRQQNPAYDWMNVASYHYSGRPVADGWADERGVPNTRYVNQTRDLLSRLGGIGSTPAGSMGGSLGGSIGTMLGGQSPSISQEFGLTDFARTQLGGQYAYSTAYGVTGHAGLDISLNPGTTLYAPVSGTVVYGGGTNYYTDARYGAGVPGTGELRLKLDNGDEVILGHMQAINVRPGQRISAGQAVGLSGTNKGGHTHLEYRKYTPGQTSSGYTAVDPRTVLNGMTSGPAPDTSTFGSSMADAARLVWDAGLRRQLLAQG